MPGRTQNDRTWTHAERDTTRFQRRRGQSTARLDDPTVEELRLAISQDYCWWCEQDGWKSLAIHTAKIHGISAFMLRERAHLTKGARVCSQEHSSNCAIRMTGHIDYQKRMKKLQRIGPKKARVYSSAGKEIQRQVLEDIRTAVGKEKMRCMQLASAKKRRTPHTCTAPGCEVIVPTAEPRTCSSKCRRKVRQITAMATRTALGRRPMCGITGCKKKHLAKGLCARHYQAARKGQALE